MRLITDPKLSEKEKKFKICEVELAGVAGEKGKKFGRVLADRLYFYSMSVDPSIVVN